jgi:hypothetical protein
VEHNRRRSVARPPHTVRCAIRTSEKDGGAHGTMDASWSSGDASTILMSNDRRLGQTLCSRRRSVRCALVAALSTGSSVAMASSDAETTPCPPAYQVRLVAEAGSLASLYNNGQFGRDATPLDLRKAAGQDSLLTYTRWSAELTLGERHTIVLLYQPLSSTGTITPQADVRERDVTFPAGQPLTTTFSFPFSRFSYVYAVVASSRSRLEFGGTGQIRNARTTFESTDGSRYSVSQGIGFVPALKARGRYDFDSGLWLGFELDGIYAPISVLNGSDNKTEGAILDASLRAGLKLPRQSEVFFNVRYLGGGATSGGDRAPSEYVKNWLHFMFVGLGAQIDLVPR